MLSETKKIYKIEIVDNIIYVTEELNIYKDKTVIASNFIRTPYSQDSDLTMADPQVLDIAKTIWPNTMGVKSVLSGSEQ